MLDRDPQSSVAKAEETPEFAPVDITDGRAALDYESHYPPEVRKEMRGEIIYLGLLLLLSPILIVLLYTGVPNRFLLLDPNVYRKISLFGTAWMSGLIGGTLFDMKWTYHVIAKTIWHQDRKFWRILTPHISAGLAFGVVALMSSGIFKIFDRSALESHSVVVAISFLVGYFSDNAIAKLAEIAETLFGRSRTKKLEKKKKPVSNTSKAKYSAN